MADSVFGDLGGPGKQTGGGAAIPDSEGGRDPALPSMGSVFGDLGGTGTQQATTTAPEPGSGDFPAY